MMNFTLLAGLWLGILQIQGQELPFQFSVSNQDGRPVFVLQNAEERIECPDVTVKGDSLFINLPLYHSEFRLKAGNGTMEGVWINYGRQQAAIIPFRAKKDVDHRFKYTRIPGTAERLQGKWETWFASGSPDSSLAIGLFRSFGEKALAGTFLTESGDHRYLEGILDGDSLKLSVFDGSHAWLYLARLEGDLLQGIFYSGNHYQAPFRAQRNDSIGLRNPEKITYADSSISFRLPDTDSNLVSLTDVQYRNRVCVIQIMGTWCPNCMDETVFLDSIYRARREEGLEIIGLAFERNSDFASATARINKTVQHLHVSYPVLLGGVARKGEVEKVLPALKGFFSYPTTLILDRRKNVVKVHTGFSGPATGAAWEEYRKEFNKTLDRLLR